MLLHVPWLGDDLRKALTIDEANNEGVKYGGLDQDFIELRLSDVILLYAEALNENGSPAATYFHYWIL